MVMDKTIDEVFGVIRMCEFDLVVDGKVVFREVIYAEAEDGKVVVKDVTKESREYPNTRIVKVDVNLRRLVLSSISS